MPYNLTGVAENTTGLLTLTQGVNEVLMDGKLGLLILIALGIVLVTSFIFVTGDIKKSVTSSMFLSFGIAFFLRMVNLIGDLALFVCLIGAAASLMFMWRE